MRIFKFKLAVVGSFHALIFHEIPKKFPLTKFFIEVSLQWVPYAIHDFARRFERAGKKVDKGEVLRKTESTSPAKPTTTFLRAQVYGRRSSRYRHRLWAQRYLVRDPGAA